MQRAVPRGLSNVHFRSPIPKRQVLGALSKASATIAMLENLPIYKYGISLNKLYDFMAAGRPVVFVGESYNNPVADSGGGIAITDRIIALARAPAAELEQYGRNGRRFVEEQHSMAILSRRLLEEVLIPLTSDHKGGP